MYRLIDMETYPRRAHFEYFTQISNPWAGVTMEVDVTELVRTCKEKKRSVNLAMVHCVALAANTVPSLRQRICAEGIREYDFCTSSHIELLEDGTYCYCALRHDMPAEEYFAYAEETRRIVLEHPSLEEADDADQQIFMSCLPWLHFTGVTQCTDATSNPRIVWGKFEENWKGRLSLPVSILTHHALVDGFHLSQFFTALDAQIKKLSE